ncbi:hypothetical protein [Streptomyces sp. NPDC046939]|uniref:hypothetical protein n=1 Tax=Streptomyces sp. NPDC046939 TaxID=3155376 RepID=UPI0033F5E2F9
MRYGAHLIEAVEVLGPVDAVSDAAAGKGSLGDNVRLVGHPQLVITLAADPAAMDHGVCL